MRLSRSALGMIEDEHEDERAEERAEEIRPVIERDASGRWPIPATWSRAPKYSDAGGALYAWVDDTGREEHPAAWHRRYHSHRALPDLGRGYPPEPEPEEVLP